MKNTLLIVDDSENDLMMLSEMLSSYTVLQATDGEQALSILDKTVPDIILLDIRMPGMNGFELCRLIKSKSNLKEVPVIFLSALTGTDDKVNALQCGGVDYITIPFQFDEVEARLETHLKIAHYRQEVKNKNIELEQALQDLRDEAEARKLVVDELRNLSRAVEYSPVIVIICDTEGNIEYVNPKFTQVTGYCLEEVVGKNPRFLKSGNMPQEIYKDLWDTIISGNEWRGELCNKKKDGTLFWESVSISTVKDNLNIPTKFVAVKEDITERKKMEEALIHSEKLKSLGTVMTGVAHEFNNILAIISGRIESLEMDYKDNKELAGELHSLMKATDDGIKISRNMLSFASAETEIETRELECSCINDIIKQTIKFTMPRWKNQSLAKGISYYFDTGGMDSNSSILCHPTEIRVVFINIIYNALNAMPGGGNISFKTWDDSDALFICISDTGEGMTEEVKKRVFDPFFTTKEMTGTGLGLSTSYGIIARHDGKIEVESEVGKGTKFTLQFPIKFKANSLDNTCIQKEETKTNAFRVLVVDDEKDICIILNKYFSRNAHKVITLNNGTDAIELIKNEEFDVVLTDMVMPDISGFDVVRAVDRRKGKRPIIGMMTGLVNNEVILDEEGVQVDFLVNKPFKLADLSKCINDAIVSKFRD